MDERLKRLYGQIEHDLLDGVYRTSFYDIAGPALRANCGKSVLMRRALGFKALMEQFDLHIREDELLLGTLRGCYPKVEMPDFEVRKDEARRVIAQYIEDRPSTGKGADTGRGLILSRAYSSGNIMFEQLQRIIAELYDEFNHISHTNNERARDGGQARDGHMACGGHMASGGQVANGGQARGGDALVGITRHEIGRELEKYFRFDFGEDGETVRGLPWHATNHNDLNAPKIVGLGLGGIRDEVLKYQSGCAPEKVEFYEAELITIDAVIAFFRRYAKVARDAAEAQRISPGRRDELLGMAETTEKVSYDKPETFKQALQLVWMMYVISNLQTNEGDGSTNSYARFDQYMYPFYKADLERGRITEEEALLYIGNLFCKINEPKMAPVVSLIVGGQTPEGREASNDITRLCILTAQALKQPYPNLTVRFCKDSPEWMYDLVAETAKMGIGNPTVVNDEVYVPNFVKLGYPIEDARDYYNMGCVENMIMGRTPIWLGVNQTDFAGTVLKTLAGGAISDTKAYIYMAPLDDKKLLIDIDELDTFDKFLEAYKDQMRFSLRDTKEKCDLQDEMLFSSWCDPFGTLVMDNCLEKGLDLYKGGCKFGPMKPVKAVGLGTAADSLAAIKKFVYDEKKLSLRQLNTILEANFEGYENERAMLANNSACYGNDDPEADIIARDVFRCFCDTVHDVNKQGIFGYACVSLFSYNGHVQIGEVLGATPNGRLRGEPVSDSMGPSQGKDSRGPTSLLKSAISLDNSNVSGAYVLNVKLTPASVRGDNGTQNLKAMVKAYLKNNGVQLQFNFVDAKTLEAAKKEPDKYRNLIVRVAGYCEYFHNLDAKMQDEIISRTAHELG